MGAVILALLAVVGPALPQQTPPGSRVRPIVGPVRDAGILHLATNTWTRKASAAQLGADVVYDNTCNPRYFSALSGDTYVDEGRLPSTTSPASSESRPGCATQYTIDGFQIGYCTLNPTPAPFEFAFYASYAACSSVIGTTPIATFAPAGLPGTPSNNWPMCWIVTIDLDASSQSFTMAADGDGTYAGASADNLFGWTIRSMVKPWAWFETGPMVAGDPSLCSRSDGTRWDSPVDYLESGTGMGSLDQFRIESGPHPARCETFGGGVFSSFHLELYADACESEVLLPYCFGDGSGTACPCGNTAPAPYGCRNSTGVGGWLHHVGAHSIAHDSFVLLGEQMPPNAPALYFQGTLRQDVVFGDGKRCAGGSVARIGVVTNSSAGTSRYPRPGDPSVSTRGQIVAPGYRTYQVWYRNAAAFCTSATFNLTNGTEVAWLP